MKVTIAVTDTTRPCPDAVLLPLLLDELEAGGVRKKDVTVLIALGMHRHTTPRERREKFGELRTTLRIEESQGADVGDFVERGPRGWWNPINTPGFRGGVRPWPLGVRGRRP
jgi:nickel-dependent lactate racemase